MENAFADGLFENLRKHLKSKNSPVFPLYDRKKSASISRIPGKRNIIQKLAYFNGITRYIEANMCE